MLQRSPIIRFALEVLQHALECYCSNKPRDKKIAVLHLTQSIELAIKAALVEKNIKIYEKDGSRTLNTHSALEQLGKAWKVERVEGQSRIELLIDERNAIRHRYGAVDDVTLDYHMQTAFDALKEILEKEFDTQLGDWIKDNVEKDIWERIRFVTGDLGESQQKPSDAMVPDRSPTLDFIDGFSRYEKSIRDTFAKVGASESFGVSTLDLVIKTISNLPTPPQELIQRIPAAYKLRNRVIHGDRETTEGDVRDALLILDETIRNVSLAQDDLLRNVLQANERGVLGTKLTDKRPDKPDPDCL